jgi:hypothetical protein
MHPMSQLEETRLAWQRAQAEYQQALADLELRVASNSDAEALLKARAEAARRQQAADNKLHRYITQLGKSD